MAAYSIQELRTKITERINSNHSRSIKGVDIQELMIDILDSLEAISEVGNHLNYYVNELTYDPNSKVLVLTRAGGIDPVNLSCLVNPSSANDLPSGEVALLSGDTPINFSQSLVEGSEFMVFGMAISSDNFSVGFSTSNHSINGFTTHVDQDCLFQWFIKLK